MACSRSRFCGVPAQSGGVQGGAHGRLAWVVTHATGILRGGFPGVETRRLTVGSPYGTRDGSADAHGRQRGWGCWDCRLAWLVTHATGILRGRVPGVETPRQTSAVPTGPETVALTRMGGKGGGVVGTAVSRGSALTRRGSCGAGFRGVKHLG